MKSLFLTICFCIIVGLAYGRVEVRKGSGDEFVVVEYAINPYTNTEQVVSARSTSLDEIESRVAVLNSELATLNEVKTLAVQLQ